MREAIFSNSSMALTGLLATRSRERKVGRQSAVRLEEITSGRRRNDVLPDLEVRQYPIDRLKAPERELRKVTAAHVAEIAQSITVFGFVKPLLVSDDGTIVDGVSSWEAARKLGLETVPCLTIDHLTRPELRRLRLALNRLGEKGTWALDELKIEFQELIELDEPLDAIGFSAPEIDLILTDGDGSLDPKANAAAEPDTSKPPVSQAGDLWILGRHRVFCGSATEPRSYEQLFGDAPSARAIFTDPPYNIRIDGFAAGKGKHSEFAQASGEMTDDEFETFLTDFLVASSAKTVDGGIVFCCMDWRHSEHVHCAARNARLELVTIAVWSKGHGGMGGLYRSAHEFVFVLRKGGGKSLNNIELGKHGRDRTNVWTYPGANRLGSSANAELHNHPTPKPVELVADALLDVTARKEIVLDPFLGSGTSIIAAEKTGRVAFGIELEPRYVDSIIRRFEDFTGQTAQHAVTCETFAATAARRAAEISEMMPVSAEMTSNEAADVALTASSSHNGSLA